MPGSPRRKLKRLEKLLERSELLACDLILAAPERSRPPHALDKINPDRDQVGVLWHNAVRHVAFSTISLRELVDHMRAELGRERWVSPWDAVPSEADKIPDDEDPRNGGQGDQDESADAPDAALQPRQHAIGVPDGSVEGPGPKSCSREPANASGAVGDQAMIVREVMENFEPCHFDDVMGLMGGLMDGPGETSELPPRKADRLEQRVDPRRFKQPCTSRAVEADWVMTVIGRDPETIRPEDAPSESAWNLLVAVIDRDEWIVEQFKRVKRDDPDPDPEDEMSTEEASVVLDRIRERMGQMNGTRIEHSKPQPGPSPDRNGDGK